MHTRRCDQGEARVLDPGPSSVAGLWRARAGLSLIEVLIAVAILAVALLALAAALVSDMVGISREGQVTVANQVAVSVIEDWRSRIREDNETPRQYDAGESGTQAVTVGEAVYSGTYTVTPRRLDASGNLMSTGGGRPHVFEVSFTITPPRGTTSRTYSTLVVANP